MDNTPAYVEFFLGTTSSVVQFETIEISHPNFSRAYRVVRNNTGGLTAKLENGNQVDFEYYPMQITQNATQDDLDYTLGLDFGDLGETLPNEIDLVEAGDGFSVRPSLIYRTYRSDNLDEPMFGPIVLEIVEFSFTKTGASFEARAPSLNLHRTGELYTVDRFPMLRGFV